VRSRDGEYPNQRQELIGSVVSIALYREGILLFQSDDIDHNWELFNKRLSGYYRTRVNLPCPLKAGSYVVGTNVGIPGSIGWIDSIPEALAFGVEEFSVDLAYRSFRRQRQGIIAADLAWESEYLKEGGE